MTLLPVAGITVKELKRLCEIAIEQGQGEKVIQISDDDEGNGFHTLYYGFDLDGKNLKYAIQNDRVHDNRGKKPVYNTKNAIILG